MGVDADGVLGKREPLATLGGKVAGGATTEVSGKVSRKG